MNWREGMRIAYSRGVYDGKMKYPNAYNGNGFDACYWQGFGHGSGECKCPEKLAGKRMSQRCIVCGNRRHIQF